MTEYRPVFAPHVRGDYSPRWEDGERVEQRWSAVCERCGDEYRGVCETGQPKRRIERFAVLHLHAER